MLRHVSRRHGLFGDHDKIRLRSLEAGQDQRLGPLVRFGDRGLVTFFEKSKSP